MVPNYIRVAERVLGRKLPCGVEVHHVDEDRRNSAHTNLVICQDRAFHMLLHIRTEALKACGNAHARRCSICGNWSDPRLDADLAVYPRPIKATPSRQRKSSITTRAVHRSCSARYQRARRRHCLPFDPREFEGQQSPVAEIING